MSRVYSLGQFIPSLGISSRSLERVNLTKLLVIQFSEHLSWEDCMSTNCQKTCHSALGILRKIKNFTRNTYLAITLAKLKLSPVRLGTGWVTNIVLKVPSYLFFLCFLFPYCPNLNALWRNIKKNSSEKWDVPTIALLSRFSIARILKLLAQISSIFSVTYFSNKYF